MKKSGHICSIYIWSKMLFSSLDTLSPQKLSAYDCVTLYVIWGVRKIKNFCINGSIIKAKFATAKQDLKGKIYSFFELDSYKIT